jgi:hypothetical protein
MIHSLVVFATNLKQDDLKKIWLCSECGICFIFSSDVDDHKKLVGHSKYVKYDIPWTEAGAFATLSPSS